jgi:hypothetical protein
MDMFVVFMKAMASQMDTYPKLIKMYTLNSAVFICPRNKKTWRRKKKTYKMGISIVSSGVSVPSSVLPTSVVFCASALLPMTRYSV